MKNPKIKVLAKRPDSNWYVTYLSNNLHNLQNFVDGYIETVTLTPNTVLVCNEEGRLLNLPYNCTIDGIRFYGNVFVCGVDGDEFSDFVLPIKEWLKLNGIKPQRG